jgi:hypothetical protein
MLADAGGAVPDSTEPDIAHFRTRSHMEVHPLPNTEKLLCLRPELHLDRVVAEPSVIRQKLTEYRNGLILRGDLTWAN